MRQTLATDVLLHHVPAALRWPYCSAAAQFESPSGRLPSQLPKLTHAYTNCIAHFVLSVVCYARSIGMQ